MFLGGGYVVLVAFRCGRYDPRETSSVCQMFFKLFKLFSNFKSNGIENNKTVFGSVLDVHSVPNW